MEYNKNKIIFWIVGGILLLSVIFLLIMINSSMNSGNEQVSRENTIRVWMVWTPFESSQLVNNFKWVYPAYKNKSFIFEFFPNYEDYNLTLSSAIISWEAPDIFVLNNNVKTTIFDNQIVWIRNSKVNPNDFRKIYKEFFGEDLIESFTLESSTMEQLKWIPIWYEPLWIFYNRRYIKNSDLSNLSSLNSLISSLKSSYSWVIPLWIWNGTTVLGSADILTQFFMLSWANSVSNLIWNPLKEWLASYLSYWDINWVNWYNTKFNELKNAGSNSVSSFINGEVFMLVGYPSLMEEIKTRWGFSRTFLEATSFPHYITGGWKSLVNYDYFVINKDSQNLDTAEDFLVYLTTDSWATTLLNVMKYYLPWLLSLEDAFWGKRLDESYNVTLWDFYNDSYEYSSFDKWIKEIYDKEITLLLDNTVYKESDYENLLRSITCKVVKFTSFTSLETNCGR